MGNETANVGPTDLDLNELRTISKIVPTTSTNAEIDVGTNGTGGNTVIEMVAIYVTNHSIEPIEYTLIYHASYSSIDEHEIACVVVNPDETVVVCKKTQPIYAATKNFYDKASSTGLQATYSYKRYGS